MSVTVFGYLFLISIYFYGFSLGLVSLGKIHQTLKTVFDHISKDLKVRQKYCTSYFQLFSQCLVMWSNMVFRV